MAYTPPQITNGYVPPQLRDLPQQQSGGLDFDSARKRREERLRQQMLQQQQMEQSFPTQKPVELEQDFQQKLQGLMGGGIRGTVDTLKGINKGFYSTVSNLSSIGQRALDTIAEPVVEAVTGQEYKPGRTANDVFGDKLKPKNTSQKIGFALEQIGEFFVPSGAGLKASSVPNMASKIGTKAAKIAAEGAGAAAVTTAQGGSKKDIALSGVLGGAGYLAAKAAGAFVEKVPQNLWSKILKRTLTQTAKNPDLPQQAAQTGKAALTQGRLSSSIQQDIQLIEMHLDDLVSKADGKIDPLIAEARKYKSAEEFVKAQGTPVYRGGDVKGLDTSKITKRGISVANTPDNAKMFAGGESGIKNGVGKIQELSLSPNAKILNLDDIPANKLETFKRLDVDGTTLKEELAVVNYAKQNGYDAVNLSRWGEGEIRIINPDVLKTKSQLTDIWNKANAGGKIDPANVARSLNTLKATYRSIPGEEGAVKIIDNIQAEMAERGTMTGLEAQSLKRQIYDLQAKSYGKGLLEVPAKVEAQKQIARALKEEIERLVPEAKKLNQQQAVYIQMRKAIERQINTGEGKGVVGLGMYDLLTGGLGTGIGMGVGNPFLGLFMVAGKKGLESTAFLSSTARLLQYFNNLSPTKKLLFYTALKGLTITGVTDTENEVDK